MCTPMRCTAILDSHHAWSVWCYQENSPAAGHMPTLDVGFTPVGASVLGARARFLLARVWAAVAPADVALPPQSLRRGPGPRAGVVATGAAAGLRWSSSISHSAAGPVAAAAVVLQPIDRSVEGPGITIGVDVEPVQRFVHPGVARLIAARAGAEAPPVSNGRVPLLAVACVKEAIFKADRWQSSRTLADYAWIEAWRTEDDGWCGVAEAVGDRTQRFTVGVLRVKGYWLAFALAKE
jgi:hypothetical protein